MDLRSFGQACRSEGQLLPVQVSAYVTAAHIKFLLLHDGRSEEATKFFFRDVYDAYLRVWLKCTLCLAGCRSGRYFG